MHYMSFLNRRKGGNNFLESNFTCKSINQFFYLKFYKKVTVKTGGDETRSGYMQYVPIISANIPCMYYVYGGY